MSGFHWAPRRRRSYPHPWPCRVKEQAQIHYGSTCHTYHPSSIAQNTTHTTPCPNQTPYEIGRPHIWWTGPPRLDFQNPTIFRLSIYSRSREAHCDNLLYGRSCFILVPVDVSEWFPHLLVCNALGIGIAFCNFLLWRPTRSFIQIAATWLYQRISHQFLTPCEPYRRASTVFTPQLLHPWSQPGLTSRGTGFPAPVPISRCGPRQTTRGQVIRPLPPLSKLIHSAIVSILCSAFAQNSFQKNFPRGDGSSMRQWFVLLLCG